MNLKKFVQLMLAISAICVLINAFKSNNWLMVVGLLSCFVGVFTPLVIGMYKGEISILVE